MPVRRAAVPETTVEALVDALHAAGLRVTRARREICAVLADRPGDHLSAADITERTRVPVDTSTVYRTLDVLEQIGYLTHVHMGHGPGVYHVEPAPPHHHLVCESCGLKVDVPVKALRDAIAAVTEPHGFVADETHFAIVGWCRECAADDR